VPDQKKPLQDISIHQSYGIMSSNPDKIAYWLFADHLVHSSNHYRY
jgi:hypothetical protein